MLLLPPNRVVGDAKLVSRLSYDFWGRFIGNQQLFINRNQLNQRRKSFPPLRAMPSTEHKSSTLWICPEITAWSVLNGVHSPISSEESPPSNFLSIYWLMTEKRKRKMCLSTWYRWIEKENFQHFFPLFFPSSRCHREHKAARGVLGPQEKNPTLLESFWMDEHDREKLGIFNDRNAGSGVFSAGNVWMWASMDISD